MKIAGTIVIAILFILATSCNTTNTSNSKNNKTQQDTVVNTNLNILISPDLSNRITEKYAKPIDDIEIIKRILELYYPSIYKSGGRVLNQKDKISLLITNPQLMNTYNINDESLKIDISGFNNDERIKYFTDPLHYKTFENDKNIMINEITKVYESAKENTVGADIYDLFKSRLNSDIILEDEKPKNSFDHIVINRNRNILILLTDGYIEAGLYGEPENKKQYFYLDNEIIRTFRKDFKKSEEINMKLFFEKNGYGLVPLANPALNNLEVLAVEFYDRSLSKKSGNNTVLPDDYDILKLFWDDWMKKSGVKRFKVYERFATINDFEVALENFINLKKQKNK
jgi:hypothetical protein